MTIEIETTEYFDSLPDDILTISIVWKGFLFLPDLTRFKKLKFLYCYNNYLTSLPTLPQNLIYFRYDNTPIYKIVNSPSVFQIKQNIKILNNFRHLYYSLKLRNWLWEKVRKTTIKNIYKPKFI